MGDAYIVRRGSLKQEKTVTAGTSATTVTPENGYLFSEVTVNPTPSHTRTVTAGTSNITFSPSAGKLLSKVTVQPTPSQSKTVTPGASAKTVSPDSGKLLSSVTVSGDADLVAGNIKSGVSIFGVDGTYETPSETKSVTPAAVSQTVTPTSGKLLSSVTVNGDVDLVAENIKSGVTIFGIDGTYETPSETKSVTPGAANKIVTPTSGKLLSSVTVNGDADLVADNIKSGATIFGVTGTYETPSETKTVVAGTSNKTVTPTSGMLLSSVTVQPTPSQSKTATPAATSQTITPTSGKLLSSVTVSGDADLVAENIKTGVTIFGVEGTYETPSETKTITAGTSNKIVTPTSGKLLSSVTVQPTPSSTKYATPQTINQDVKPDSGKLLSNVIVYGDADLVAKNIKNGVTIFGVEGTYETPSETKTATAGTSNITVTPTTGKLLSKVTVEPTPSQTKSVTPGATSKTVSPDSGKLLSSVTVSGDGDLIADNIKNGVSIFGVTGTYDTPSMEKTVTAGTSAITVTPEEGYLLSEVTVNPTPSQTKSITPGASAKTVTPDSGKLLSKVTVNGDADLIASNIKSGVNIFGVNGTLLDSDVEWLETGEINILRSGETTLTLSHSNPTDVVIGRVDGPSSGEFYAAYGTSRIGRLNFVSDSTSEITSANITVSGNTITIGRTGYAMYLDYTAYKLK